MATTVSAQSCHPRLLNPQSHVGLCSPEIRPLQKGDRVVRNRQRRKYIFSAIRAPTPHRIFVLAAATARPSDTLDRRLRSGEHRIVDAGQIVRVAINPSSFGSAAAACRAAPVVDASGPAALMSVRPLSQTSDTNRRQCPGGGLARNALAGAQHVVCDCQLMGRRANIPLSVMEHQGFEVDKFAVDPERGAGVCEILPSEEARSNRPAGDALV